MYGCVSVRVCVWMLTKVAQIVTVACRDLQFCMHRPFNESWSETKLHGTQWASFDGYASAYTRYLDTAAAKRQRTVILLTQLTTLFSRVMTVIYCD